MSTMEELIASSVAFIILFLLTKQVLHKLQNLPPTPFPAIPILGHFHLFKPPFHRNLSALSARYGPVLLLRLGCRRILVVSSPSAAEDCLSNNDVVFANRPRLLNGDLFGYHFTNIIWAPYGELWRNLRRIATTEVLSSHRLSLLSHIRADEIKIERAIDFLARFNRLSSPAPQQMSDCVTLVTKEETEGRRKLMSEFTEFVTGDEVDEFLRPGFDLVSKNPPIRRLYAFGPRIVSNSNND